MIRFSSVEMTSVTSKPDKEKGMEYNQKLLMEVCVLSPSESGTP
jgi:hypothetical protein